MLTTTEYDYLDIEATLTLRLQREWRKVAAVYATELQDAAAAQDWVRAQEVAESIDASGVGETCKSFAYAVFREAMDFGARMASNDRPLTSSLAFETTLTRVVNQLLQGIEWSVTMAAQKAAMQSIADARGGVLILKANPYHDENGLFTTADKAKNVVFHGTSVADLIEKDGFKVVPGKNGRLLGDGIYLSSSKYTSEQYAKEVNGKVLEVSLDGLAIKEFPKSMAYTKFLMKNGDSELTPESMANTMRSLGFDGVKVADNFAVFSPEKLKIVSDVKKAEHKWFIVVTKAIKKADPIRPFVSFKKEGDKMLQMISGLHTNRLASWGFIAEADVRGTTTYKLNAMLDNRTSEFCRLINGKEFQLDDARQVIEAAVNTDDPAQLKGLQPWPNQNKASIESYKTMSDSDLVANKMHVPPFHPYCRTIMVLVSRVVRLEKPAEREQVIPAAVATPEDFKDLGSSLSEGKLAVWNDYVGLKPVDVVSHLSGQKPIDLVSQTPKTSKISVTSRNDIKITWANENKDYNFEGSIVFTPSSGVIFQSKTHFISGSQYDINNAFRGYQRALLDVARSVGATKVITPIAEGQALAMAHLGYTPLPYQWQVIRASIFEELTGDLADGFAQLSAPVQVAVQAVLQSKNEKGLRALAHLNLPKKFLRAMFDKLHFEAQLDLTDSPTMALVKSLL